MLIPMEISFPKMALVAQRIATPRLEDVPRAIRAEIARLGVAARLTPGMRIAITAGSRGITGLPVILATVVGEMKRYGAAPFLVPTMGSHGGATAEGQSELLNALGVSEEAVGCPIRSSMDTVQIGRTPEGIPVFLDKLAAEADGIIVVGRVKAHTDFAGPVESGLMKMLTIGLGKHQGAIAAHRHALQLTFPVVITSVGREVIRSARLLFGLGVVENAYDQTSEVAAIWPQDFEEVEKSLLVRAKALMPRLPFAKLDILVVDQIGKEISGAGLDPNIIGRLPRNEPGFASPVITRIVVRDLSERSHGNGIGIGMADFTTRRFVEKFDPRPTYINTITSGVPDKARIPITGETDREVIEWAFQTIGAVEPQRARVVRIQNTLHVERFFASEALLPEILADDHLEILGDWAPFAFDEAGTLWPERVL